MRLISLLLVVLLVGACSRAELPSLERLPGPTDLPFIHKIDIQQGNVVTQDMLAQLRPAMEKKKVLFVMGTPVVQDTFNAGRWDYIYMFHEGGGDTERRLITLVFKDDKLHHLEGDVVAAEGVLVAELHHDTTVNVPRFRPKSFATRVKEKLPFVEETSNDLAEDEELTEEEKQRIAEAFKREDEVDDDPYLDIQAAPGEGVVVVPDAPLKKKKKGFFARLVDSIGIGADEDDDTPDENQQRGSRGFQDVTNPEDL